MSVGHIEIKSPCVARIPKKKTLSAKYATIKRMREYAKKIGEDKDTTEEKVKAIIKHSLSSGTIVTCETGGMIYTIPIKK